MLVEVKMELSGVVYRENKSGPRTEPWGTPCVRGQLMDFELPQEVMKERLER